jgi:hypothetical protein
MKHNPLTLVGLALVSAFSLQPSAFPQGSLTPPGAPAPTMKTLAQIEPRTPISFAPFIITQPGSYYLTTNLSVTIGDAIDIATNRVTLDLNGFTISSTANPSGGYGVKLAVPSGNSDVSIFNGHVVGGVTNNGTTFSGPGFSSGIDLPSTTLQNIRVTCVTVSGCAGYGIYLGLGDSTIVESCIVQNISSDGIVAGSVSHSTAFQCGNYGIYATIASDCTGQGIGTGTGLYVSQAAHNCSGSSAGSGTGIYAASGVAIGCYGSSVSGFGIIAKIANSCVVDGGATNITFKYNMP